jgi:hypothetical protein
MITADQAQAKIRPYLDPRAGGEIIEVTTGQLADFVNADRREQRERIAKALRHNGTLTVAGVEALIRGLEEGA